MRRKYNKKNHTNYTREEFAQIVAMARIKSGNMNFSDLGLNKPFVHMDNEVVAPEDSIVKLNYDKIYDRPTEDKTQEFIDWVEANKDKEFHLTREGAENSLVSLKEDIRYTELDGEKVQSPRWLFDLYCDLLIKYNDEWHTAIEIEELMEQNKAEETDKEDNNH